MERRLKRLYIDATNARLKASGDDAGTGTLEGYASTFGNVDLQGDIIARGAFAKTISERVPAGRVKLMAQHASTAHSVLDVVGTVTEASEDAHGLLIKATFAGTQAGQDVRKLVAGGHVSGLSVGFWVLDAEPINEGGLLIKECKLEEVTVTAFPANEQAQITAAKSLTEYEAHIADIEKIDDDVARAEEVRRLRLDITGGADIEKILARLKTLEAPRQHTANAVVDYVMRSKLARARLRLQTLGCN